MSDISDAAYRLAVIAGPDLAIERIAQVYDAILFPGCGDIIRNVWADVRPSFMGLSEAWALETGPAHELAYYGGDL